MAQLTDETIPTEQDARLFAARFDEVNPCRGHFLTALSTARPDLVPIFTDATIKGDAIAILVVERKITWAETAKRTQANTIDLQQKIAAAERQWIADLNASHQSEMAQRQAAATAMMQWSAQQQMINAMNRPPPPPVYQMPVNRPWSATCSQVGGFTNCTGN